MKIAIKNISPVLLACIMLVVLSIIVLLPIDSILIKMSLSDFQAEYIGLSIKMAIIFLISYRLIKKMRIESISGISSNYGWKFKYLNIIPVYLIIIGVLSIISKDLTQIHIENVLLLLLACLTVGFGEEFIFRGLLQPLFLKRYIKHRRGLFLGVFIPALFFGLFHLVNLIDSQEVLPVLIQVVFATFIGFFFGVLVLKTNKLIPLAITHGLINFFLSLQTLPNLNDASVNNVSQEGVGAALGPLILFFPLFIIGLIIIINMNKESTQEKLQASFN